MATVHPFRRPAARVPSKWGTTSIPVPADCPHPHPIPNSGPSPDSPDWRSSRRVMVVGEGPGEQEAVSGLPFFDADYYRVRLYDENGRRRTGPSGQELTRLLAVADLPRPTVLVTNLTRYFSPHSNPTLTDVTRDAPILIRELRQYQPQYVLAVGRLSTRWFLGDVDMEVVHGLPHPASVHDHLDNLVWDGVVIPCIHPAAGLYSPDVQPRIAYDFQQAGLCVQGKIAPHPPSDQYPNPRYEELTDDAHHAVSLICRPHQTVFIDSEGSAADPWSLQFSLEPGTGFLIRPHSTRVLAAFLLWWQTSRPLTVFHNSLHDIDVMRGMGRPYSFDLIRSGIPFLDTMIMAYHLQLEPQGLKPLAYRHAGMVMESYDDLMSGPAHSMAMAYIDEMARHDWPRPDPRVVRDGIDTRVYQPLSATTWVKKLLTDLHNGKVDKEGNPPDPRKRWSQVDDEVKSMVEAKLGPMPSPTLSDVPFPRALHYGCRDSDATARIFPHLRKRVLAMGLSQTHNIDMDVLPMIEYMQHRGMPYDPDYFVQLSEDMQTRKDKTLFELKKEIGYRINPNSADQVAAVLYGGELKQGGEVVAVLDTRSGINLNEVKTSKKTGKLKTDKKAVERLRTTDRAVDLIIRYREEDKVDSSFAIPISKVRAWALRNNRPLDRCPCTMRISRVVTGRLSATAIEQGIGANLLAIPVRTDLGLLVRKGFVARPCPACGQERVLGTWDLDQIEMRVMADESQDPLLLELFNDPRRDVHSETAALMFRIDGASYLNKYSGVHKVKHRYPAKRVGFGVITGIQGPGLLDQMRMAGIEGWTRESCDEIIQRWFEIYPGVRLYMDKCRAEALEQGFVRDRWGRIRYLPGANSPLRHIQEEALRQSHSHKIQAGAQGLMKRAMKAIWDLLPDLNDAFRTCDVCVPIEPLLQVHDELLFEMTDDPAIKGVADEVIVHALTTTTPLSIPLGAKGGTGPTWASLEK